MRNALNSVPKRAQQMVAAMVRTILAQTDLESAKEMLGRVCNVFRAKFP